MQSSHDTKGSIPMDMCSLGVVDLDLSISPDAFGLRAFDHKKPLTRLINWPLLQLGGRVTSRCRI